MNDELIYFDYRGSTTHKHMKISDRAAKFAPFAALVGYDQMIDESNRFTDPSIALALDKADDLDHMLKQLNTILDSRPMVELRVFQADDRKQGGSYHNIKGSLIKIDYNQHALLLSDGSTIPVSSIIDIHCPLLDPLNECES